MRSTYADKLTAGSVNIQELDTENDTIWFLDSLVILLTKQICHEEEVNLVLILFLTDWHSWLLSIPTELHKNVDPSLRNLPRENVCLSPCKRNVNIVIKQSIQLQEDPYNVALCFPAQDKTIQRYCLKNKENKFRKTK